MATKPTIYKCKIALADIDQGYYDNLNLTVALHPSETLERMMMRVLAYCLNAQQLPEFTKGLYEPEEPDLWVKSLDGLINLWIEVGEPTAERIKKASRKAKRVVVYTFNSKSDAWWAQTQRDVVKYGVQAQQFLYKDIQSMAALCERTLDASLTLTENSALFSTDNGVCQLVWSELNN